MTWIILGEEDKKRRMVDNNTRHLDLGFIDVIGIIIKINS
jgi:hypothetical protein